MDAQIKEILENKNIYSQNKRLHQYMINNGVDELLLVIKNFKLENVFVDQFKDYAENSEITREQYRILEIIYVIILLKNKVSFYSRVGRNKQSMWEIKQQRKNSNSSSLKIDLQQQSFFEYLRTFSEKDGDSYQNISGNSKNIIDKSPELPTNIFLINKNGRIEDDSSIFFYEFEIIVQDVKMCNYDTLFVLEDVLAISKKAFKLHKDLVQICHPKYFSRITKSTIEISFEYINNCISEMNHDYNDYLSRINQLPKPYNLLRLPGISSLENVKKTDQYKTFNRYCYPDKELSELKDTKIEYDDNINNNSMSNNIYYVNLSEPNICIYNIMFQLNNQKKPHPGQIFYLEKKFDFDSFKRVFQDITDMIIFLVLGGSEKDNLVCELTYANWKPWTCANIFILNDVTKTSLTQIPNIRQYKEPLSNQDIWSLFKQQIQYDRIGIKTFYLIYGPSQSGKSEWIKRNIGLGNTNKNYFTLSLRPNYKVRSLLRTIKSISSTEFSLHINVSYLAPLEEVSRFLYPLTYGVILDEKIGELVFIPPTCQLSIYLEITSDSLPQLEKSIPLATNLATKFFLFPLDQQPEQQRQQLLETQAEMAEKLHLHQQHQDKKQKLNQEIEEIEKQKSPNQFDQTKAIRVQINNLDAQQQKLQQQLKQHQDHLQEEQAIQFQKLQSQSTDEILCFSYISCDFDYKPLPSSTISNLENYVEHIQEILKNELCIQSSLAKAEDLFNIFKEKKYYSQKHCFFKLLANRLQFLGTYYDYLMELGSSDRITGGNSMKMAPSFKLVYSLFVLESLCLSQPQSQDFSIPFVSMYSFKVESYQVKECKLKFFFNQDIPNLTNKIENKDYYFIIQERKKDSMEKELAAILRNQEEPKEMQLDPLNVNEIYYLLIFWKKLEFNGNLVLSGNTGVGKTFLFKHFPTLINFKHQLVAHKIRGLIHEDIANFFLSDKMPSKLIANEKLKQELQAKKEPLDQTIRSIHSNIKDNQKSIDFLKRILDQIKFIISEFTAIDDDLLQESLKQPILDIDFVCKQIQQLSIAPPREVFQRVSVNQHFTCNIFYDTLNKINRNSLKLAKLNPDFKMVVIFDNMNTAPTDSLALMTELIMDHTLDGLSIGTENIIWVGTIVIPPLGSENKEVAPLLVKNTSTSLDIIRVDLDSLGQQSIQAFLKTLPKDLAEALKIGLEGQTIDQVATVPSIRDLIRAKDLYDFLNSHQNIFNHDLLDHNKISYETSAIIIVVRVMLLNRILSRKERNYLETLYHQFFKKILENSFSFFDIFESAYKTFIDKNLKRSPLPNTIIKTVGWYKTNFYMLLSILINQPLCIVGPPGCSKTFSLETIDLLRPDLFEDIKQFRLACNSRVGEKDIQALYQLANDYSNNNPKSICMVILDDAGLLEQENSPLGILNDYSDKNIPVNNRITTVVISDKILDASITNRMLLFYLADSDKNLHFPVKKLGIGDFKEISQTLIGRPKTKDSSVTSSRGSLSRFIMTIDPTENRRTLQLLSLKGFEIPKMTTLRVPYFQKDQAEHYVPQILNQITNLMKSDITLVLVNGDTVMEYLYDVFNLDFNGVIQLDFKGRARDSYRPMSPKFLVSPRFKLIVHLEQYKIKSTPLTLLDRFEKVIVTLDSKDTDLFKTEEDFPKFLLEKDINDTILSFIYNEQLNYKTIIDESKELEQNVIRKIMKVLPLESTNLALLPPDQLILDNYLGFDINKPLPKQVNVIYIRSPLWVIEQYIINNCVGPFEIHIFEQYTDEFEFKSTLKPTIQNHFVALTFNSSLDQKKIDIVLETFQDYLRNAHQNRLTILCSSQDYKLKLVHPYLDKPFEYQYVDSLSAPNPRTKAVHNLFQIYCGQKSDSQQSVYQFLKQVVSKVVISLVENIVIPSSLGYTFQSTKAQGFYSNDKGKRVEIIKEFFINPPPKLLNTILRVLYIDWLQFSVFEGILKNVATRKSEYSHLSYFEQIYCMIEEQISVYCSLLLTFMLNHFSLEYILHKNNIADSKIIQLFIESLPGIVHQVKTIDFMIRLRHPLVRNKAPMLSLFDSIYQILNEKYQSVLLSNKGNSSIQTCDLILEFSDQVSLHSIEKIVEYISSDSKLDDDFRYDFFSRIFNLNPKFNEIFSILTNLLLKRDLKKLKEVKLSILKYWNLFQYQSAYRIVNSILTILVKFNPEYDLIYFFKSNIINMISLEKTQDFLEFLKMLSFQFLYQGIKSTLSSEENLSQWIRVTRKIFNIFPIESFSHQLENLNNPFANINLQYVVSVHSIYTILISFLANNKPMNFIYSVFNGLITVNARLDKLILNDFINDFKFIQKVKSPFIDDQLLFDILEPLTLIPFNAGSLFKKISSGDLNGTIGWYAQIIKRHVINADGIVEFTQELSDEIENEIQKKGFPTLSPCLFGAKPTDQLNSYLNIPSRLFDQSHLITTVYFILFDFYTQTFSDQPIDVVLEMRQQSYNTIIQLLAIDTYLVQLFSDLVSSQDIKEIDPKLCEIMCEILYPESDQQRLNQITFIQTIKDDQSLENLFTNQEFVEKYSLKKFFINEKLETNNHNLLSFTLPKNSSWESIIYQDIREAIDSASPIAIKKLMVHCNTPDRKCLFRTCFLLLLYQDYQTYTDIATLDKYTKLLNGENQEVSKYFNLASYKHIFNLFLNPATMKPNILIHKVLERDDKKSGYFKAIGQLIINFVALAIGSNKCTYLYHLPLHPLEVAGRYFPACEVGNIFRDCGFKLEDETKTMGNNYLYHAIVSTTSWSIFSFAVSVLPEYTKSLLNPSVHFASELKIPKSQDHHIALSNYVFERALAGFSVVFEHPSITNLLINPSLFLSEFVYQIWSQGFTITNSSGVLKSSFEKNDIAPYENYLTEVLDNLFNSIDTLKASRATQHTSPTYDRIIQIRNIYTKSNYSPLLSIEAINSFIQPKYKILVYFSNEINRICISNHFPKLIRFLELLYNSFENVLPESYLDRPISDCFNYLVENKKGGTLELERAIKDMEESWKAIIESMDLMEGGCRDRPDYEKIIYPINQQDTLLSQVIFSFDSAGSGAIIDLIENWVSQIQNHLAHLLDEIPLSPLFKDLVTSGDEDYDSIPLTLSDIDPSLTYNHLLIGSNLNPAKYYQFLCTAMSKYQNFLRNGFSPNLDMIQTKVIEKYLPGKLLSGPQFDGFKKAFAFRKESPNGNLSPPSVTIPTISTLKNFIYLSEPIKDCYCIIGKLLSTYPDKFEPMFGICQIKTKLFNYFRSIKINGDTSPCFSLLLKLIMYLRMKLINLQEKDIVSTFSVEKSPSDKLIQSELGFGDIPNYESFSGANLPSLLLALLDILFSANFDSNSFNDSTNIEKLNTLSESIQHIKAQKNDFIKTIENFMGYPTLSEFAMLYHYIPTYSASFAIIQQKTIKKKKKHILYLIGEKGKVQLFKSLIGFYPNDYQYMDLNRAQVTLSPTLTLTDCGSFSSYSEPSRTPHPSILFFVINPHSGRFDLQKFKTIKSIVERCTWTKFAIIFNITSKTIFDLFDSKFGEIQSKTVELINHPIEVILHDANKDILPTIENLIKEI
ncbi:hypothetical protein CYY_006054 [Polysphondylium violaceum]|uniref:AAA+ ATPase domain-containing protein n=1 Tax=Polysphondylium violaceum TaxID=133409 RepID=A0A8J4URR6_9MYCE|nr:hypothetical protein CYY_006054 [Polysphondylium violaceum]